MISKIRRPNISNGAYILEDIPIDRVQVTESAIISIDGSTTNTGLAIIREKDGALFYSCAFTREKDSGETPVQYKVRLKRAVKQMLESNMLISKIYYEEPFVGYTTAAPNLFMLRTFVEELIVENEPQFDYLFHTEVNNKRWKKLFLAPEKCPSGTEAEKAAVRKKLETYLPFAKDLSQDEVDAISLGFVACTSLKNGTEEELETKKVRPFKYNIAFIGADSDDDMCMEFMNTYTGPKYLLDEGVGFSEVKGTADFDKHVYKAMGQHDRVLVIKFDSHKHANLILQYKIGSLAAQYDYIYAIVWRKTRKL